MSSHLAHAANVVGRMSWPTGVKRVVPTVDMGAIARESNRLPSRTGKIGRLDRSVTLRSTSHARGVCPVRFPQLQWKRIIFSIRLWRGRDGVRVGGNEHGQHRRAGAFERILLEDNVGPLIVTYGASMPPILKSFTPTAAVGVEGHVEWERGGRVTTTAAARCESVIDTLGAVVVNEGEKGPTERLTPNHSAGEWGGR